MYKQNTTGFIVSLKETIIIYGSSLIITIMFIIYFLINDYPLVATYKGILDIRTPPFYMISIFIPYGILLGEALYIWINKKNKIFILLLIECFLLAVLSFIRILTKVPISGHTVIIFFYILHQIITNRLRYRIRTIIGLIVLIIIVYFKIFLWNDIMTLISGGIIGIILFFLGFYYRHRYKCQV